MRNFVNQTKSLALIFLITVFCLSSIEVLFRSFYTNGDAYILKSWMQSKPKPYKNDPDFEIVLKSFDGSCKHPPVLHNDGLSAYQKDFSCAEVTYQNGKRITKPIIENWNKTIHVFGGSTVWGTGSVDGKTIPSYIQKSLKEKDIRVLNYGVISYVVKQQNNTVRAFIDDIKKGDIVIYYDGGNDFWNGVMYGNLDGFIVGYNVENKLELYNHLIKKWLYENVIFYRFLSDKKHGKKVSRDCSVTGELANSRVFDAANHYSKRILEAKNLVKLKGATFLHFLQPTIFESETPTEYESKILKNDPCWLLAAPVKRYYNQLFLKTSVESIDLSQLLVGTDLFYDFLHPTARGNKLVAEEMVEIMKTNKLF